MPYKSPLWASRYPKLAVIDEAPNDPIAPQGIKANHYFQCQTPVIVFI